MKRSTDAVIDLTEGSSFEDEPETKKKKKENVKETKEKDTNESIDLTKDDEEVATSSKAEMERLGLALFFQKGAMSLCVCHAVSFAKKYFV